MISERVVLRAIGSTETTDFMEFCEGLGDNCPVKGDKESWQEVWQTLERLERRGLVEVTRENRRFIDAILTADGVEEARR